MATKNSKHSRITRRQNNPVTPRTTNQRNRRFWDRQNKLMHRRISDGAILAVAMSYVHSDYERMVPLAWQISFVQALATAELATRLAHSDFSRRGGMTRKGNALRELIEGIVLEDPNTTQRELFHKLRKCEGGGIVNS